MSLSDDLLKEVKPKKYPSLPRDIQPHQKRPRNMKYIGPVSKQDMQALDCDTFYNLVPEKKGRRNIISGPGEIKLRDELRALIQGGGKPISSYALLYAYSTINTALRRKSFCGRSYHVLSEDVDDVPYFQLWEFEDVPK